MKVEQIATIMNNITTQILGDGAIQTVDLSNIVDMGEAILNATSYDHFVKSLVDHVGRVVFVDRVYQGSAPSVLMDGWEYGAILEKIRSEMPTAVTNPSWELTDGQSYDPNIFHKPKATAKFFSSRVTFEVDISVTERQVRSAFSNAAQLNAFISMIYNEVDKSFTVKLDALIMQTINNLTAQTLIKEFPEQNYTAKSGVRAVNLLKLFNDHYHSDGNNLLTVEQSILDPDFIRFASYHMAMYEEHLRSMSTLFNIEGKQRFTPTDMLHVVMLSRFKSAAAVYLQSDTFHEQYVALPKAEGVPFWQGSGTDFSFNSCSDIHVNVKDITDSSGVASEEVIASGILAVMFDRDALGVSNMNRRTTSNVNGKAEFTNLFYKMDAGYFNDLSENFVVFFVA